MLAVTANRAAVSKLYSKGSFFIETVVDICQYFEISVIKDFILSTLSSAIQNTLHILLAHLILQHPMIQVVFYEFHFTA